MIISGPNETKRQYAEIVKVTPEQAALWLERNTINRTLSDITVRKYARDMQRGRWVLNGQTICFDVNGNVANGQHRLWGCVESESAFETWVIWNVPEAAFATTDVGKKRSAADALDVASKKAGGEHQPYASHIAALARVYIGWVNGDWKGQRGTNEVTHDEVLAMVATDPEAFRWAATLGHKVRGAVGLNTRGWALCIYLFGCAAGQEAAEAFWLPVIHGADLLHDDPRLALRNWARARSTTRGTRMPLSDQVNATISAWNGWCSGKGLSVIRFRMETPAIQVPKRRL